MKHETVFYTTQAPYMKPRRAEITISPNSNKKITSDSEYDKKTDLTKGKKRYIVNMLVIRIKDNLLSNDL